MPCWPCTSYNNECNSRYGDPRVQDTTWVTGNYMRPSMQPAQNSPAVGPQWPDGYVGALPASGVADVIPPAAITNLGASGAEPQPTPNSATPGDGKNGGDPPRTPGSESTPSDGPRLKPAPWSPRRP